MTESTAQILDDENTVAYWRKALSDYPNDRGQVLRSGMEAALRTIDRLSTDLSAARLAYGREKAITRGREVGEQRTLGKDNTITRPVTFDHSAHAHVHEGTVAELHLGCHAAAQISEIPEGQGVGFLIRVWPPDALHQYGGENGTALTALVKFADGNWTVESLHIDRKWGA